MGPGYVLGTVALTANWTYPKWQTNEQLARLMGWKPKCERINYINKRNNQRKFGLSQILSTVGSHTDSQSNFVHRGSHTDSQSNFVHRGIPHWLSVKFCPPWVPTLTLSQIFSTVGPTLTLFGKKPDLRREKPWINHLELWQGQSYWHEGLSRTDDLRFVS